METFLIRTLQLVMSLSLLVVIHEMGHFLFAHAGRKVLPLLRSLVHTVQVQTQEQRNGIWNRLATAGRIR